MREQSDQMRQATTAKVCLDLAKSGRFTVPVLSTAGFNRPLLALSTICRCPSRSKERSWPRNRGNLANVGLEVEDIVQVASVGRMQSAVLVVEDTLARLGAGSRPWSNAIL